MQCRKYRSSSLCATAAPRCTWFSSAAAGPQGSGDNNDKGICLEGYPCSKVASKDLCERSRGCEWLAPPSGARAFCADRNMATMTSAWKVDNKDEEDSRTDLKNRKISLSIPRITRELGLKGREVIYPEVLYLMLNVHTLFPNQRTGKVEGTAIHTTSEIRCATCVSDHGAVAVSSPQAVLTLSRELNRYTCVFVYIVVHQTPQGTVDLSAFLPNHAIFALLHRATTDAPWALSVCEPNNKSQAMEGVREGCVRALAPLRLGLEPSSSGVRDLGSCFRVNCTLQGGFCFSEACIDVLVLLWCAATARRGQTLRHGNDAAAWLLEGNARLAADPEQQKAFVRYMFNLKELAPLAPSYARTMARGLPLGLTLAAASLLSRPRASAPEPRALAPQLPVPHDLYHLSVAEARHQDDRHRWMRANPASWQRREDFQDYDDDADMQHVRDYDDADMHRFSIIRRPQEKKKKKKKGEEDATTTLRHLHTGATVGAAAAALGLAALVGEPMVPKYKRPRGIRYAADRG